MSRISRELWQNITKKYRLKRIGHVDSSGSMAIYMADKIFLSRQKLEKIKGQKRVK